MNRMKLFAALALGACCAFGALSRADEEKKEAKSNPDKEFATKAGAAGLAEVNLSNLAMTLARDPAVRQFAQRMVADHGKANRELIALANSRQISLPNREDKKHLQKSDALKKLTGSDFDHAYMECMLKDHEEAVQLFEKESKNGKDEGLKAWAGNTLPTLKEHLAMARKMTKRDKERTDK